MFRAFAVLSAGSFVVSTVLYRLTICIRLHEAFLKEWKEYGLLNLVLRLTCTVQRRAYQIKSRALGTTLAEEE